MEAKLNTVIYEFERVTGKTADEVIEKKSSKDTFGFFKNPRLKFSSLSSPKLYYIYLPLLILILLGTLRPRFLYVKEDGKSPVFSFAKLASFTVIFSILIIIAYYVFQYQKMAT